MPVTLLGIATEVRPEQFVNAEELISTVPCSIAMLVFSGIVPLYLYATLPKYISPSGILLYHAVPSKASPPILVILLGMMTEVSPEHPEKERLPMLVTLFGMLIEVRTEQFSKALLPILVTLLGIAMDVRPEQFLKASSLMDSTLLGISMDVRPEQFRKAQNPILFT